MHCVTLEIALIMKGIIRAIREGGWKGCVYICNARLALKKAIRELKREMCIFSTWKLWSDGFFFDPNQDGFALMTLICAKIANSLLSHSIFHLVVPLFLLLSITRAVSHCTEVSDLYIRIPYIFQWWDSTAQMSGLLVQGKSEGRGLADGHKHWAPAFCSANLQVHRRGQSILSWKRPVRIIEPNCWFCRMT